MVVVLYYKMYFALCWIFGDPGNFLSVIVRPYALKRGTRGRVYIDQPTTLVGKCGVVHLTILCQALCPETRNERKGNYHADETGGENCRSYSYQPSAKPCDDWLLKMAS